MREATWPAVADSGEVIFTVIGELGSFGLYRRECGDKMAFIYCIV
jgi:hypothetical protein